LTRRQQQHRRRARGWIAAVVVALLTGGLAAPAVAGAEGAAQEFEVSIAPVGRDGQPAPHWQASVSDPETGDQWHLSSPDDSFDQTVMLPEGDYTVDVSIFQGASFPDNTGMVWLVVPHLTLSGDTEIAADARDARPIEMTMPDGQAEQRSLAVGFRLHPPDGGPAVRYQALAWGGLPGGVRTAQLGEPAEGWEISGYASTMWLNGENQYHGVNTRDGSFYTGLTQHTTREELAHITVGQGASMPGRNGILDVQSTEMDYAIDVPTGSLPRTSEVYVQASAGQWRFGFHQEDSEFVYETEYLRGYQEYRAGEEYASADVPLDEATFEVPAGEAEYELETVVRRKPADGADVSSEVEAHFRFTSATTEERTALPASTVRFTPGLAPDSTAPAGETMTIPVTVQGTAAGGNVERLGVGVSYDGGDTWEAAPVENGAITVTNPPAGGSVSLDAGLVDGQGNGAGLTIYDAYHTV
jgi:hypothetical protein